MRDRCKNNNKLLSIAQRPLYKQITVGKRNYFLFRIERVFYIFASFKEVSRQFYRISQNHKLTENFYKSLIMNMCSTSTEVYSK